MDLKHRPLSGLDHEGFDGRDSRPSFQPNGPDRPLFGPKMKKALAITAVIVLVAVGVRFAWDQVRATPVGRALHAAQQATQHLFSSEDIMRSGPMITGALIREQYLPADGRGYTQRVSYTDRDSVAKWTQEATFDAIVKTSVDTRQLPQDAVSIKWATPTSLVYVVRLPQPRLAEPFWVSEPRDIQVHCNVAETIWRFVTVHPSACSNEGLGTNPHLRSQVEQDFRVTALGDAELLASGRSDVEDLVKGIASPFIDPLAKRYGITYSFEFVWYTPAA